MAFIPVEDTVMIEQVFELDNQIVENTYYVRAADPSGLAEGEILSLLGAIRVFIQSELMPALSTALKLVRLVGTVLDAVDALSVTLSVSPPFPGSKLGSPSPNNVTYCVTFLTAQRGRSFRGRNYVPGFTEEMYSINTVNPTTRTDLLAFYTGLKALISENGYTMVVVSRFHDNAPRVAGVTAPIIDFTTFDTNLDSQRRRLPGRGS